MVKYKFIILTVITVLLIPFCLGEAFCRLMCPHIDLWELAGRRPTSIANEWKVTDAFSAFKGRPGYIYKDKKLHKTINDFGFISTPNLTVDKPDKTIRIVFLGGSSTAGTGWNLSDEDTWPWQTIQLIKKEFPKLDIDFINGAVSGYTSFESYGRLWSRISFFNPDIICVYHGWNEMYYFTKNNMDNIVRWKEKSDGSWDIDKPVYAKIIKPLFLDYLIQHSQLLIRIRLKLSKLPGGEIGNGKKEQFLSKGYDKRGLEVFRKNLQLIKMATELMKAKLFVCKQATLIVPGLTPDQQKHCRFDYHGFNYEAHIDAFRNIYRIIEQEIDAESIIDVTSISGKPEYFNDHIHPTKQGSYEIAKIVSGQIIRWISSRYNKTGDSEHFIRADR
jgi:hypothetical protein